jgi:hypothetical protein
MFAARAPLDEATGQRLAEWAAGGAAPRASAAAMDAGRKPILQDLATLRTKLGWTQDAAKQWRLDRFGEADPMKLTIQQLEDARTLMGLLADGNEQQYGTELDTLAEIGRVRGAEAAA